MSIINVDCVYLASEMNRISISWENLSQYPATFLIIIGVFRTLSNMMELFVKIWNGFFFFFCIIDVCHGSECASDLDTVTFQTKTLSKIFKICLFVCLTNLQHHIALKILSNFLADISSFWEVGKKAWFFLPSSR